MGNLWKESFWWTANIENVIYFLRLKPTNAHYDKAVEESLNFMDLNRNMKNMPYLNVTSANLQLLN